MLNYFCVLNFFPIEVKSSILRGVCVYCLSVSVFVWHMYVQGVHVCAHICSGQKRVSGVPLHYFLFYSLERLSSTEPGLGSLQETHLKPLVSNSHSAMDTNTRIVVPHLSWVLGIWTQALCLKSKCSWPLSHVPRQRDAFNINLQIIKMACSWNNQKKNRRLKLYVKECILPLQSSSVPWQLWPALVFAIIDWAVIRGRDPGSEFPLMGRAVGHPWLYEYAYGSSNPVFLREGNWSSRVHCLSHPEPQGWQDSFPDVPSSATASMFRSDRKGTHLGIDDWSVPKEMPPGVKALTLTYMSFIYYIVSKDGSYVQSSQFEGKDLSFT